MDGHNGPGRYLSIFGERHFLNRPNGREKGTIPPAVQVMVPALHSEATQVGYEHAGEQRVRLKEGKAAVPVAQGAKKGGASLQNGKGDTEETGEFPILVGSFGPLVLLPVQRGRSSWGVWASEKGSQIVATFDSRFPRFRLTLKAIAISFR